MPNKVIFVSASDLKEPLSAEEERPRHAGMGDAESDAAFSPVIEIFLIQYVQHIESQQHFLIVPRQGNRMAN